MVSCLKRVVVVYGRVFQSNVVSAEEECKAGVTSVQTSIDVKLELALFPSLGFKLLLFFHKELIVGCN